MNKKDYHEYPECFQVTLDFVYEALGPVRGKDIPVHEVILKAVRKDYRRFGKIIRTKQEIVDLFSELRSSRERISDMKLCDYDINTYKQWRFAYEQN